MTEEELYTEYRKNNCKSFTDFLINEITKLKNEVLEVRQHLDLTEREWGKDLDKQIHFKTLCTKLEKENAELKERLKEHESVGNAQFWENVWSWKTEADQLTKAKDLLKRCYENYIYLEPLRSEIEQFLSEVEK
jgi:hypothetical protein